MDRYGTRYLVPFSKKQQRSCGYTGLYCNLWYESMRFYNFIGCCLLILLGNHWNLLLRVPALRHTPAVLKILFHGVLHLHCHCFPWTVTREKRWPRLGLANKGENKAYNYAENTDTSEFNQNWCSGASSNFVSKLCIYTVYMVNITDVTAERTCESRLIGNPRVDLCVCVFGSTLVIKKANRALAEGPPSCLSSIFFTLGLDLQAKVKSIAMAVELCQSDLDLLDIHVLVSQLGSATRRSNKS